MRNQTVILRYLILFKQNHLATNASSIIGILRPYCPFFCGFILWYQLFYCKRNLPVYSTSWHGCCQKCFRNPLFRYHSSGIYQGENSVFAGFFHAFSVRDFWCSPESDLFLSGAFPDFGSKCIYFYDYLSPVCIYRCNYIKSGKNDLAQIGWAYHFVCGSGYA